MLDVILTTLLGRLCKIDVTRNSNGYSIQFYFDCCPASPKFSVKVPLLDDVVKAVSLVYFGDYFAVKVPDWLETTIQALRVIKQHPWMKDVGLVFSLNANDNIVDDVLNLLKREIEDFHIKATKEGESWRIEIWRTG